ncbi:MAG: 2OG-Fe(II) oxygenase [Myxococcota bacterium]|nr:2OG-Fe(II) oxygenase [Myxococcota bacterium]
MSRYAPIDRAAPQMWTVPDWMSATECADAIARAEALGFETASIAYREGARVDLDARNNARVTLEDEALAAVMFERARPHLPPLDGGHAIALSPRWRVYRYAPEERFTVHRDGFVRRDDGATSRVTLMIYLCDVEAGGETAFPSESRVVAPRTGTAVFFQHALLHEARPVLAGRKYVLRTDVLYAPG